MIDNLNVIYGALLQLPEKVECPEQLIEKLTVLDSILDRSAKVERLEKVTVYDYRFIRHGFGVTLSLRTMHGPFAVQKYTLHVGMKRYSCVVIGSEVTLTDYPYADKLVVEEMLSKLSRLITDITLNYKEETL